MSEADYNGDMAYQEGIVPVAKAVWRGRHLRQHPLNLDNPRKVRLFLEQERFWVNAGLEEVRVKNMDVDYLFSTMIHLIKRSPELALTVYLDLAQRGDQPADLISNPYLFIRTTPLFRRLEERYLKLVIG
jgi:hypothetical protein